MNLTQCILYSIFDYFREQVRENASVTMEEMDDKNHEVSKLRRKNESLSRKCTRMREYVKNLTSKCKEWEDTYIEKENVTQAFQRKYETAMFKITEMTSQINITSASVSTSSQNNSKGTSGLEDKENMVSQLKKDVGKRDRKIKSLKRRLLERSVNDDNFGTTV